MTGGRVDSGGSGGSAQKEEKRGAAAPFFSIWEEKEGSGRHDSLGIGPKIKELIEDAVVSAVRACKRQSFRPP